MAPLIEQPELLETTSNCTESDDEESCSFEQTQGQLMQNRGDLKSMKPIFRANAPDFSKPRKHRSASWSRGMPETKSMLPELTDDLSALNAPLELARLPLWRTGTPPAPRHGGDRARLPPLGGAAAGCGLQAVRAGRANERGRSDAGPRRKATKEHQTMMMAGGGFSAAAGFRTMRQLDAPVGLSVMSLQTPSPSEASTRSSSRVSSRNSSRASSRTSSRPSSRP